MPGYHQSMEGVTKHIREEMNLECKTVLRERYSHTYKDFKVI